MPRLDDDSGVGAPGRPTTPTLRGRCRRVRRGGRRLVGHSATSSAILAPVLAAVGARTRAVPKFMPAEACVAFTDDAAMRRLNGHFRGKDKPTNVLSFPSGMPAVEGARRNLGDIVLGCRDGGAGGRRTSHCAGRSSAPSRAARPAASDGLRPRDRQRRRGHGSARNCDSGPLGIANPYEEAADAPAAQ